VGLLSGLRALAGKLTAVARCSRCRPWRGNRPAQQLLAAALAVGAAVPTWAQSHPSIAQSQISNTDGSQVTVGGSITPDYQLDRSEEDWGGFCRLATRRDDFWDRLKCVGPGRPFWYVSFGAELRSSYEIYRDYNCGNGPQDENGYYLNRLIGHADFQIGPRIIVRRVVITLTTDDSYPIETVPHPRLYSRDQDRCAGSIFGHLET
jgi:hypothetical protein